MEKNKQYYLDRYNDLYDECYKEAMKIYPDGVSDTANEILEVRCRESEDYIVGYYLDVYGNDALKQWLNNVKFVTTRLNQKQTEFDEGVTMILTKLFGDGEGHDNE